MKRAIQLTCGLVVAGGLAWAGEEISPASLLNLTVSTHSGRAPLYLTLEGSLAGVEPALAATCQLQSEYEYAHKSGNPVNSRKTSACAEEPGALSITPTFRKDLVLSEPGTCTCRILLQGKDGRQIAGKTHHVTVYHPSEVGVAVRRSF